MSCCRCRCLHCRSLASLLASLLFLFGRDNSLALRRHQHSLHFVEKIVRIFLNIIFLFWSWDADITGPFALTWVTTREIHRFQRWLDWSSLFATQKRQTSRRQLQLSVLALPHLPSGGSRPLTPRFNRLLVPSAEVLNEDQNHGCDTNGASKESNVHRNAFHVLPKCWFRDFEPFFLQAVKFTPGLMPSPIQLEWAKSWSCWGSVAPQWSSGQLLLLWRPGRSRRGCRPGSTRIQQEQLWAWSLSSLLHQLINL